MLNRGRAHELRPQPLGISADLESEWGPLQWFPWLTKEDVALFWRFKAAIHSRRPRVKAGRKPRRFT